MKFQKIGRAGTFSTKYCDAVKKFGTNDLLPMWVADMDISSPDCVAEAIQNRASHPLYGYTVYPERYYEAIQRWYDTQYHWQVESPWIIPCYGVVPSLHVAIRALTKEGDGVLIQSPIYPPFFSSVKHNRRKVLDNTLVYENGAYHVDLEDFEAKAKEATLFLLCSPHNPTGRAWSRMELEAMVDICIAHHVTIVSDEIHADIVYHRQHLSLGSLVQAKERTIILNAPSKTFNIAGLNTSYAIIPNDSLRRKYEIEQHKLGISNSNPFGIEGLIAAYEKGETWLQELREHLYKNIQYVETFIQIHKLPIKVIKSDATYLLWLDCSAMTLPHEAVVKFWIEEAKLGLNDGMSFGKAGEGFMRLNIGTSFEQLEEAMYRLLAACENRFPS